MRHFLIVKGCAYMFTAMATKFAQRATIIPHNDGSTKAKANEPTFASLAAQAHRALRDRECVDVTGMSHAERNKIIFGK